jgi:hypothetical protein
MRMRRLSIFLIILFSSHAAIAQTRTVIAGKPFTLYAASSTNPDCWRFRDGKAVEFYEMFDTAAAFAAATP